ncbi:TIGR00255 family protein [Cetobacterium ceti]|uniref:TIGR00255 family protein n=1 Tax=Cetobacterium ceti TaxID=180163 RepID=A0A1T4QA88_9FUSO|nr:YicC/YloC family endoribonuclease [Cetobacterium ceti]SKA00557.1 TIGR00255 family protein [Cetobacterium ceti]
MRSMTGYSKVVFQNEDFVINLEIKSVNNKNLNLKIKVPYTLNFLENKIRAFVGKKIFRGSVDLKIDFEDKRVSENLFDYNKVLSDAYMEILNQMEIDYKDTFTSKLDLLVKNLNVIKRKDEEIDEEEYTSFIFEKLDVLLEKFIQMKSEEGLRLKEYFKERISFLEIKVEEIKTLQPKVVETYREKLLERLNSIREDINFTEEDLLKEILLFTDKSDISEETSRLSSHLYELKKEIESEDKTLGKKIDFILQEIFRELNTTGVKSNFYEISKIVVDCKNEIEKIREQALNIE